MCQEKAKVGVLRLKGEKGGVAVVRFSKVVIHLRLRGGAGVEKMEAAYVQYMEVMAPFDYLEKSLIVSLFWVIYF